MLVKVYGNAQCMMHNGLLNEINKFCNFAVDVLNARCVLLLCSLCLNLDMCVYLLKVDHCFLSNFLGLLLISPHFYNVQKRTHLTFAECCLPFPSSKPSSPLAGSILIPLLFPVTFVPAGVGGFLRWHIVEATSFRSCSRLSDVPVVII